MKKNKGIKEVVEEQAPAEAEPAPAAAPTPVVEPAPAVESVPQAEPAPKKSKKHNLPLILFFTTLGVASIVVFAFLGLRQQFNTTGFKKFRTIEYGSTYEEDLGRVCYGNNFSCEDVEYTVEGEVSTNKLGEYTLNVHYMINDQTIDLEQMVHVMDTIAPEFSTEIEVVSVCPNGKISPFEYTLTDNYDEDIKSRVKLTHTDDKVLFKVMDSNGNETKREFPATVEDTIAPTITLNGEAEITINLYDNYQDAGATVIDNCDEVELQTTGGVDANNPGTYEITYSATDESGNSASVSRKVNVVKPTPVNGTIYLTFDDGPSGYTGALLDVLKKYNVRATFFVTNSGSDDMILREYQEGHAVGLHTATHNYAYIYQNMDTFFEDLYSVQERVRRITGYTSTLMRFPGGSSNTVSALYDGGQRIMSKLVNAVTEKGFTYFDWNISSGDAGGAYTADMVYNNVIRQLGNGGSYVVLQHDIKGFSVDAVESIIQYGLSRGYAFDKLTPSSFTAHHGVNN